MSTKSRGPTKKLRYGSPQKVGMSAARLRSVVGLVRQWVDEGVAQTIEVLVVRHGTIVLHEVSGRLTSAANSPPTPKRGIFPIASITKLLTATALMILVEEGRVGLNRPVNTYVPEFAGEGKEGVLVRHLLTHTSGLREEDIEKHAQEQQGKIKIPSPEPGVHPLIQEYHSLRYAAPLWKAPGSEMSYADFNFDLTADIVRRASGIPLDRFAESRIFKPLGMKNTYYCRVDADARRLVRRPPDPRPPGSPPNPWLDAVRASMDTERIYDGSGFAVSTVLDLAIFGQMFLNRGVYGSSRVLSPVSVAEMTRNQIPGIGASFEGQVFPEAVWGLGWSVHGDKTGECGALYSPGSYEHWGAGGRYVWVDPDLDIVGVYLSSTVSQWGSRQWLKYWRNDLFTDAVTASVVER